MVILGMTSKVVAMGVDIHTMAVTQQEHLEVLVVGLVHLVEVVEVVET